MKGMGILTLASGQALPGPGQPFCHQEEGNCIFLKWMRSEWEYGICDLVFLSLSGGLRATKTQTLHRQLVKYGDHVSEPRLPSM